MTPDFWLGVLTGAIAGGAAIGSLILRLAHSRRQATDDEGGHHHFGPWRL